MKIFAPDLVANYLGAHSVPKGSTAQEATADIVQKQIPALVVSIHLCLRIMVEVTFNREQSNRSF